MEIDYAAAAAAQRRYFESNVTLPYAFRKAMLEKLMRALSAYESRLLAALTEDLGKPAFEGYEAELAIVRAEIRHTLKNLKAWMRPKRVATPIVHFPSRSKIYAEPAGVVLVMSPWNYPLQLTLAPLAAAISAGCCVIVKPSRYSAATSRVIEEMVKETFPPEYVTVFQGGSAVNQALLDVKFDHIFFTGSVAVGRVVMEKAAAFLTPVTLELGGKSPCIVDETACLPVAARRIVWGKCMNSGQTCVAPDYLFVQRSVRERLLAEIKKAVHELYGEDLLKNSDYCKIVNQKHYERLTAMLADGTPVTGGQADPEARKIAFTVLTDVREHSPLLTDEIFGPILPVLEYERLDEVISYVRARPKPLALYLFTRSREAERRVVSELSFGGGCVNDTLIHLTNPNMHFGGVGESGMGAYHGAKGFETFSHLKPVLKKSAKTDIRFRYPPYGDRLGSLKRLMK